MTFKLALEQRQIQTLVLSPQMQQAIYLLQLPLLELRQYLQQQLVQNPVLEEAERMETSLQEEERPVDQEKGDQQRDIKEEMERLAKFDGEWQRYFRDVNALGRIETDEEKRRFFENSLTRQPSLQEDLLHQLRMAISSPREEEIGEAIIGNIDENGYLQVSVEELTKSLGATGKEIEGVLSLIQSFDPPGVGAKDLRECLLIQLKNLGEEDTLATEIIANHLKDLERRKYQKIAKRLDISLNKVVKAAERISHLEPKPGRGFSPERNQPIVPELALKKVDDEYHIIMNDRELPHLQVSSLYRKLMEKGNSEPRIREYLLDKFKSAMWVIKSIEQRRKTIRRVTECIVRKQRQFLDKGIQYLKPCTLGDIAAEIGMHESTISRVTTNKYIDTPQGIFELKYFFTNQVSSRNNGSLSSESIKADIRELIEQEDGQCPLSDAEIAKHFVDKGVRIARRTVAKYRESLRLLPSGLRKRY